MYNSKNCHVFKKSIAAKTIMFFHDLVAFFTGLSGKEWDSELIFFRRVRITFFHDLNCGLVFRRVIESEQMDIRMLDASERRTHYNSEFGIKTSNKQLFVSILPFPLYFLMILSYHELNICVLFCYQKVILGFER